MSTTLGTTLGRVLGGVWWYLRTASGESRWDEYVDRCTREGAVPMSRRDFERHRADVREHSPAARCC